MSAQRKRSLDTPLPKAHCGHRERTCSFSSDSSDDLDALDRELVAEEAAAANLVQKRRLACSHERLPVEIKEFELDHVCEDIYEKMEEAAMLELLAELEYEIVAEVSEQTAGGSMPNSLHWDVVATPDMMKQFAATVASTAVHVSG